MPNYNYRCNDCEYSFEVRHSMNYEDQVCLKCGSKNIFNVPCILEKIKITKKKQVGKIVDEYIDQAKKDIKKDKSKLTDGEY
jgi:putative FmdB family regulatory protein